MTLQKITATKNNTVRKKREKSPGGTDKHTKNAEGQLTTKDRMKESRKSRVCGYFSITIMQGDKGHFHDLQLLLRISKKHKNYIDYMSQ